MKRKSEILPILTEWLIILSCFTYPLQAMVVLASKADSSPINLAFRAFYLLLAGILLLSSLPELIRFFKSLRQGKFRFSFFSFRSGPVIILLLFWIIYGIRLVYELEYQDWRFQSYSDFYIYSWAFGVTLLPTLAILVNGHTLNAKRLTRNAIIFLALSNLAITFSLVHFSETGIAGIFSNRGNVMLQAESDKPDLSLINSITISLYGEWLALAVLAWVLCFKQKNSFWVTLLLISSLVLGLFNLLAGASRGPLLDFLLILMAFVMIGIVTLIKHFLKLNHLKFNHLILNNLKHKTFSFSKILWILFFLIIIAAGVWKLRTLNLNEVAIVPRIQGMLTEAHEGSQYSRLTIWKRAWYQFTVNPIFGDSIINDVGYFYSHNIFMDALMSVGIVGTIPFLLWFFLSFWYFIRLPGHRKKELSLLFTLYLAALLLSMTSGGIFTVPEVWILSAAVIALSSERYEGRKVGM